MAPTYCAGCNGTEFHYSRRRNAIVCDICGRPLPDMLALEDQARYGSDRSMAIRHIRAGDYDSAKSYLENMRRKHPDDPDIYALHLMGLTKRGVDLMPNPRDPRLPIAEGHYETLRGLGGDTSQFDDYGRRRMEYLETYWGYKHTEAKQKLLIFSITAGVSLLFCFAVSWAFIIVTIAAVGLLCRQNVTEDLRESAKTVAACRTEGHSNPFIH